eukprot:15443786-Alexandrium_andersonii.AAC.1
MPRSRTSGAPPTPGTRARRMRSAPTPGPTLAARSPQSRTLSTSRPTSSSRVSPCSQRWGAGQPVEFSPEQRSRTSGMDIRGQTPWLQLRGT